MTAQAPRGSAHSTLSAPSLLLNPRLVHVCISRTGDFLSTGCKGRLLSVAETCVDDRPLSIHVRIGRDVPVNRKGKYQSM